MKKFMKSLKNEKGMELIQTLGLAAIAIVLVSLIYTTLNTNFGDWMKTLDNNMDSLLAKFNIPA